MFRAAVLLSCFFLWATLPAGAAAKKSDGMHVEYYDTGEKRFETNYRNGKPDGRSLEYNKRGKVISRTKYKDGVAVSRYESEPFRDLGKFTFFKKWWFWLALLLPCVGLWFLFTRVMMKGKM